MPGVSVYPFLNLCCYAVTRPAKPGLYFTNRHTCCAIKMYSDLSPGFMNRTFSMEVPISKNSNLPFHRLPCHSSVFYYIASNNASTFFKLFNISAMVSLEPRFSFQSALCSFVPAPSFIRISSPVERADRLAETPDLPAEKPLTCHRNPDLPAENSDLSTET